MHNIYTGYFAKVDDYKRDGLVPYSIVFSNKIKIEKVYWFVPPIELVKGHKSGMISDEEYTSRYLSQLEEYEHHIMLNLRDILMSNDSDIILLCYEKPGRFCHRHILSKWLSNKLGIEVAEYKS